MTNFDPAFSSESFRGRKRHTTRILSSVGRSLSPPGPPDSALAAPGSPILNFIHFQFIQKGKCYASRVFLLDFRVSPTLVQVDFSKSQNLSEELICNSVKIAKISWKMPDFEGFLEGFWQNLGTMAKPWNQLTYHENKYLAR